MLIIENFSYVKVSKIRVQITLAVKNDSTQTSLEPINVSSGKMIKLAFGKTYFIPNTRNTEVVWEIS